MTIMYCPKCKTNVLTKREDIDICLIIILAIFTAGIGVIIYLIIYFSNEPIRCVYCNSICQISTKKEIVVNENGKKTVQLNNIDQFSQNIEESKQEVSHISYCYHCGEKLDDRTELKFCPFCGINIK
ncbi:MAG: hypothetical protein ACTSRH_00375 [Promethearchaeota archaeon]